MSVLIAIGLVGQAGGALGLAPGLWVLFVAIGLTFATYALIIRTLGWKVASFVFMIDAVFLLLIVLITGYKAGK